MIATNIDIYNAKVKINIRTAIFKRNNELYTEHDRAIVPNLVVKTITKNKRSKQQKKHTTLGVIGATSDQTYNTSNNK